MAAGVRRLCYNKNWLAYYADHAAALEQDIERRLQKPFEKPSPPLNPLPMQWRGDLYTALSPGGEDIDFSNGLSGR
jgi:hypothetical protein